MTIDMNDREDGALIRDRPRLSSEPCRRWRWIVFSNRLHWYLST